MYSPEMMPMERQNYVKRQFLGYESPRQEKDGFWYGEWDSAMAEVEESEHNEARFESKLAKVDIQTGKGGENSKYQKNEDSMFAMANSDRVVMGVIDGAGGSGNGELASKVGSAVLSRAFREGMELDDAMLEADTAIRGQAKGGYAVGVVVCVDGDGGEKRVSIAYVGDAKAMTLHEGKKFAPGTTRFQNLAQRDIDIGDIRPEEYYNHPNLNLITNALGSPRREKNPSLIEFAVESGDIIISASDGFWDNVSEFEVEELAAACPDSSELQRKLYELALERNNTEEPFTIRHSKDIEVKKQLCRKIRSAGGTDSVKKAGDNITVGVLRIS